MADGLPSGFSVSGKSRNVARVTPVQGDTAEAAASSASAPAGPGAGLSMDAFEGESKTGPRGVGSGAAGSGDATGTRTGMRPARRRLSLTPSQDADGKSSVGKFGSGVVPIAQSYRLTPKRSMRSRPSAGTAAGAGAKPEPGAVASSGGGHGSNGLAKAADAARGGGDSSGGGGSDGGGGGGGSGGAAGDAKGAATIGSRSSLIGSRFPASPKRPPSLTDIGASESMRAGMRGGVRAAVALLKIREDAQFRRKLFGTHLHGEAPASAELPRTGLDKLWHTLILPHSTGKKTWDVLFVAALLWVTIRVPFLLAFEERASSTAAVGDILVDVVFIVDVIVMFRTIRIDDGEVVADPFEVGRRYLRTWFIIDAVASIPFTWFMSSEFSDLRALQLLRLLRLLRINRIETAEKTVVEMAELSQRQQAFMKLIKLFFYVSVTGHVTACIWYYIAREEGHATNSWTNLYLDPPLSQVGSHEYGTYSLYMSALYWSFTTLTTVGYGDVSAHTDYERAFSLFMILMGAVVFALIVGRITALSRELNERESQRRRHQLATNQFLKHYQMPKAVRVRTRQYYQGLARMDPFFQNTHLVNSMSPALRRSVMMEMRKPIISAVPVFSLASYGLQSTIAQMLKPSFAVKDEWIVVVGEPAEEMYFILDGTVQLVDNTGRVLVELERGNLFNEAPVLEDSVVRVSAAAKTNCEMFFMTTTDVRAVQYRFPQFGRALRDIATLSRSMYRAATNARSSGAAQSASARVPEASPTGPKSPLTAKSTAATGTSGAGDGHASSNESESSADSASATVITRLAPPGSARSWSQVHDTGRFSRYYASMVRRNRTLQAARYTPRPRKLDAVRLPVEVSHDVIRFLAHNAHDVWAFNAFADGWAVGAVRDETALTHPSLVPWKELPEDKRASYVAFADQTVRMLVALGVEVSLPHDARGELEDALGWVFGDSEGDGFDAKRSTGAMSVGSNGAGASRIKTRRSNASSRGAGDYEDIPEEGATEAAPDGGADDAGAGGTVPEVLRSKGGSQEQRAAATSAASSAAAAATSGFGGEVTKAGVVRVTSSGGRDEDIDTMVRVLTKGDKSFDEALAAASMDDDATTTATERDRSEQYFPAPFDPVNAALDEAMYPVVEIVARNAHEVWAASMKKAGWRWASQTNAARQVHRGLLPFEFISESDMEIDRAAVAQTVRALMGMGFVLAPPSEAQLHRQLHLSEVDAAVDRSPTQAPRSDLGRMGSQSSLRVGTDAPGGLRATGGVGGATSAAGSPVMGGMVKSASHSILRTHASGGSQRSGLGRGASTWSRAPAAPGSRGSGPRRSSLDGDGGGMASGTPVSGVGADGSGVARVHERLSHLEHAIRLIAGALRVNVDVAVGPRSSLAATGGGGAPGDRSPSPASVAPQRRRSSAMWENLTNSIGDPLAP